MFFIFKSLPTSLFQREAVKKFDSPMKSAFIVVQGTGKFERAKPGGQE
jgi:hypothetical protein